MTDGAEIEIVPRRISAPVIAQRIEVATEEIRRFVRDGGSAVLVDEDRSSSELLQRLSQEFGVAIVAGWDDAILRDPTAFIGGLPTHDRLSIDLSGSWRGAPRAAQGVQQRHVAETVRRLSSADRKLVLVVNPHEGSQALRDAREAGASVVALPRRRTVLRRDDATVVAWRRATDLSPLLMAIRPADFRAWRSEYASLARPALNLAPAEPSLDLDLRETLRPAQRREFARGRGGRITLTSIQKSDIREALERLGVLWHSLEDDAEWVIGGYPVSKRRAVQITRGNFASEFEVQLVWGGADPTPSEILELEEGVTARL